MGMKPTVPDDGSVQKQIGSAYDVVKSVADNLPAVLAVTQAVEDAQEVIADITEQVQLATIAANNASQVVGTIEGLKAQTESARDLAEDYRDGALTAKNDAEAAQAVVVPLAADFQTKWPTFTANYADMIIKYGQIVDMHDDVDADRIAAESARSKAELWATGAVDVIVEAGKYSAMHWATKASGFNTLAQGYATTANQKAIDANQSAIDAASSVTVAAGHVTAAGQQATNAADSATTAAGHVTIALGHANTALGYKDQAWQYREEARGYAEDAAAIVGGDFVPRSTTVNGLSLTGNIVLTATQLTDLVPKTTTVNSKALTGNIVLGVNDISGAARTDGTNATGTWPIVAAKANTLLKVLQTSDTGASNAAMYCKVLRVNLGTQYHEYTGFLAVVLGNSGSGTASTEFLSIRVKQQLAFGNNPNIDCNSVVLGTPYNAVVFGYTIVQNTPTTIVDFYIQINNGWTAADISVLQEKMSGTDASRIWYNQDAFVASVSGFVAGTRTFAVKTTDTTNKVLWANITPATSIVNLQTLLENASTGYLKKTAASTYNVLTIPASDIPNLDASKITAGTLPVGRGGTGVITLTGLVKGNGTGAFSAATAGVDYVAPSGSITGNAATATKLASIVQINGVNFDGSASITIPAPSNVATADALTTARAITITGDADWTVNFKGDVPVSSALTLKNVSAGGTATKVTYNTKGLVTGSSALLEADIPNLSASKITSGVIADARISGAYTGITSLTLDKLMANGTVISRGSPTEGGQMILGYGGGVAQTIAGQENNTWNIDVDVSNNLRFFRVNSSGQSKIAVTINEVTGNVLNNYKTQLVGADTEAPLGISNRASDPTVLADGDVWIRSNTLFARLSGTTRTLIHSGNPTTLASDVTQAEAEAGTITSRRWFTPQIIAQAIAAQAAPKTSTSDRITALENAPDSSIIARKALALAIMGL